MEGGSSATGQSYSSSYSDDEESCSLVSLDINFQGASSPQTFCKGLCVWYQSAKTNIDIAETPFKLCRSNRLRPLRGEFLISFNKQKVEHVRCLSLGKVDNHSTLKFHLEIYERIEETVAVLLINNSSELELNPQLCIPDFQIHIPVYITSANNQQILENCTHCEFFDSTNEHQGLCMNAGASVTTFLEYLNTYIFPDGESPVTISEDYTLFQQITDAVINKEQLLKGKNVDKAIATLCNNLHKLFDDDFLFLINLLGLLLKSKDRLDNSKKNSKISTAINVLHDHIKNHMFNISTEQLIKTVNSFYERGNFEVNMFRSGDSTIPSTVYHSLHTTILILVQDLKGQIKDEKVDDKNPLIRLTALIKWISVAIKFKDCGIDSCQLSPFSAWENMRNLLSITTLSVEFLNGLVKCFNGIKCLELPVECDFFHCGALEMMLKKKGRPRSFSEMKNVILRMHEMIPADKFCHYFCHKALEVHINDLPLADEMTKKQEAVSSSPSNKHIITEGFEYLENVYCVCKHSYNEELESGFKEWITHLFQFLEITAEQNLAILDKIVLRDTYSFLSSQKVLSIHCFNEVQKKGQKNLQSIDLRQFIELSHRYKIWNAEIILQFFKHYEGKIMSKTDAEIFSDHHENALVHFSESFQGASNHKFLIDHLLIPLSKCYALRKEVTGFVLHLLQLEVKSLLEIKEDSDGETVREFCDFFQKYLSKNEAKNLLAKHETFSEIQAQLKLPGNFKKIILKEIAKNLSTFSVSHPEETWLYMLRMIVCSVCKDTKGMHTENHQSLEFYWQIIGPVCEKIHVSEKSMNWICKYKKILTRIGVINRECRSESGVFSLPKIPEVKAYTDIADTLKQALVKHKSQLNRNEVNHDQLVDYLCNWENINEVAETFGMPKGIVVQDAIVKSKKKDFCNLHFEISRLLIRSTDSSHWLSLHNMLLAYKVQFPIELLNEIMNLVYFPDTKHNEEICQQLPTSDSLCIHIKDTVTLKKLIKLVKSIKSFLDPLFLMMPMLDHFHLQKSFMFEVYMKELLQHDESVTAQQLVEALKSVKLKLANILNGTAKYDDIKAFSNISDIRQEIKIVTKFVDFHSCANVDVVVSHFKNKMIIQEILESINLLFTFCEDFQLQYCLNSENMIELKKIMAENKIETIPQKHLQSITDTVEKIESHLGIHQNHGEILKLFGSLNTDTNELRQFLDENNFRGKGRFQFEQSLTLITQQLQHEEYNADVLANLYAVYYLLEPLNNPDLSFHDLIKTVSQLEAPTCFSQLRTVKNNIDFIRIWFTRAEGDTIANTATELHSINTNGKFYITVSSLVEKAEERIVLKFQLQQTESSSDITIFTDRKVVWNMTEIEDFVRRLGFSDLSSGKDNTRAFMKLFKMVKKMQKLMESLREMGHPEYYNDDVFPYEVKSSANVSELVKLTKNEKEWSDKTSTDRENFKWLSFLTNGGVLELYKVLASGDQSEIFRQLSFLMPVDSVVVMKHFESMMDSMKFVAVPTEMEDIPKSPTEKVGSFLFQFLGLEILPPPPHSSRFHSHAVLHQCHKFSPKQLIVYLVSINEQIPQPYEILRCHFGTTESDIKLFFQRIEFFPRHYYILEVNKIPSKLQEALLQQYMDTYERMLKSTIHFIETSPSLLYNAPYINTTTLLLNENVLKDDHCFNVVELVYGLQGDGKTHYIKSQLCQSSVILAINESFHIKSILDKLNSLNDANECSIHFNFTLLPPGNSVSDEETKQFTQLMDKIGWFMFDLFILGYVQDSHTGISFTVPKGVNWKVYIEVPSISNDPQTNLSLFRDLIPTFCFIGTERHIDSSIPYVVDDDVQLVCKYLWALDEEKRRPGWGIDKNFFSDPIKFGDKPDFEASVCLRLLNEHMPDLIKEHKISQKLFIKYMKRRCQFLDNFPAYNYNQGRGPKGGNTKKLGSTLLKAMLKEVLQFCDPSTKEDWSIQAHQQLIYEQHGGGGSIDLITLYPDKIAQEDKESFQALDLEIPTMEKLYERSTLDEYLAKALSLPLPEVTEVQVRTDKKGKPIEETHYKRLKIIDDNNYVLTLDYTLKMINIHERRECGMPVIIEGETGVGKTELLKMLSKLWNYSWEVQWSKQKEELQTLLVDIQKKRELSVESSLQHQLTALEKSIKAVEVNGPCSDMDVIVEALMKLIENPLVSLLQPKHMKPNFQEFLDQPNNQIESTFKFLRALFATDVSTFYKLNVHSGLKPSDVISFFDEVSKQAELIKKSFETSNHVPQVTVYLDEINTSSCMGLFKEIVVDKTIDGKPLPDNVFIIAACNPLRGDSTAVLRNMKNVWHKPSYYVRELHPTIDYLKWDYGALNHVQELEYITAKMRILTEDAFSFETEELTYLIRESQIKIREYAERTLTEAGYLPQEAKKSARSCVSQRDMQRVFDFHKWLFNTYKESQRYSTPKEQQLRSVLVALGLVYYLRLGDKDRKSYSEFLDTQCRDLGNVDFTTAFNEELDWYMERVDLPPGIAKTTALKENVFANIACCQTHTPLIIIGEPGTSKTLSFNIVANTFKGRASKHQDFRVIKLFKGLQPFFYQCSQHTNSKEIERLFKKAKQRQDIYETSSVPTYCVVFMDEAGLPEERHESLKVLHYHLDKREVSFVAITNHALDAAKTNRAISLYRPETSTNDLEILAKYLLPATNPMTQLETDMIVKFCSAFSALMKKNKFRGFYGQRDFLHFVRFLQIERGNGFLNEEIVLDALERNLNGHEDFPEVCNYFLKEIGANYDDMHHKNVLKIVDLSLKDLPSSRSQTTETESRSDQLAYTEHGVRYKLIIDGSEDDSAVRYLFTCGVLNKGNTLMFSCSEFVDESHIHINTISGIIHSVEQGHTILMFQTDEIHESFYELFNQRFRILDDPKKGLRLFTNISIGAHTKPCRVHPEFQCIVVVKKSELKKTPQPFLNRFEKFLFSYNAIYASVCETKPPNIKIIIDIVFKKTSLLVNMLDGSRSFYGYTPQRQEFDVTSVDLMSEQSTLNNNGDKLSHETLHSLLLSLLPSLDHKYQIGCEIEEININDDKYSTILATTLNAFQTKAGWNIPWISEDEFKAESKIIFDMLLKDTGFSGAVGKPKFDFKGAAGEALDALHSSKGIIRFMDEDSCLIIAIIVQWLVRYVTKHLMHLLTPEALIIKARHIPTILMKSYFEFQEHFSLKILIKLLLEKLEKNQWKPKLCMMKALVYTRQSHLFGYLPSSYPSEGIKEDTLRLLQSVIYDDLHALKIYKITPDTLEREIEGQIQMFVESGNHTIFLIIANMQDVTLKMINHLRILVEQKENESENGKLIVFLLKFPQGQQLFTHCYPALFLSGWDHFYLDSLTTDVSICGLPKPLQNVVDIRQCFRVALCIASSDDSVSLSLEPLLKEAIPVISPRVIVGSTNKIYNKPMSIKERQKLLKKLLLKDNAQQEDCLCTPLGKALCSLFTQYWDNITVTKFLEAAASFSFRHQSTLSITSYIQTRIKALFFEFVVYMLWKINEDCNLDCYEFSDSSSTIIVEELFGSITKNLFFKAPSLSSLTHACHSLPPPENKGFEFPFFGIICHYLEEMLDCCREIVNKNMNSKEHNPQSSTSITTKVLEEKKIFELMKNNLQKLSDDEATTDENLMMLILSPVMKMLNDELWQRYKRDFIKHMCMSDSQITEASDIDPVIDAYFNFNQVKSEDPISLLAWIHVHSEINRMTIIQNIDQMLKLKPFLHNQPHDTIAGAVIQHSFESLKNIINLWSDEKIDDLKQWCLTYQNIIQIASLYNSCHELPVENRLLFFKIHLMYILITSSESLMMTNSVNFAVKYYQEHIVMKVSDTNVECVASDCISALGNQGTPFTYSVVDKILSFLFHVVNLPIDMQSCQWFFREALPSSPDSIPLMNHISLAQYKYYLLHILTKDDQLNTDQKDSDDVLNLFQPSLRMAIGEMISTIDPVECAQVFITDQSMSSTEMCVLAKMYLWAAYEQICNTTTDMNLLVAITKLETLFEKVESSTNGAKKKLLILEREAFMQKCLHLVAMNLSETAASQEMILGRLPLKIDTLLQKEGFEDKRGLVLTLHLWKELKSTEKLIKIMTELPPDKIVCLNKYSNQLRQHQDDKSMQFSLPSLFKEDSALGKLYVEICMLMRKIHRKQCKAKELKEKVNACNQTVLKLDFSTGVFQIQKINAVLMCIWLCTYYEYYQKNVKSESLTKAVNEQLEGYFSDQVIRLIICFLNKDLVQKHPEFDTPSDLNVADRPVQQRQGGRVDPIYKLFFPDKPDTHDRQICNALASVVAVTLACPEQTTHLWYHIFSPDELLGTYITGFLLDSEIKEGRLYDCGVVLNEQGEYGRPEYLQRAEKGILNLHSLYLLLWCNFGAFCVSLLTQRGSIIKGTVISDYQAIRHYCKSQMNVMWLHMSTNLGLTDEQLSLLIVRSVQRMIQIWCENPKSGLLNTSKERDDYEEMWHKEVFVPSLDEVRTKIDQYSQVLQTNRLLKNLRDLKSIYPFPLTLQDFSHYVQEHCLSNQKKGPHELLVRFINRYPRLQAGGALLPSLIEFYLWIHTDLSYAITKKQANEMTVDDAVELAAGKHLKELNHYTKLFERVTESYNHYLETIGHYISAGACVNVRRENTTPRITRKTPLFHFLPGETSDEKEEQRDFIFLVIEDIVSFHNQFLDEMRSLAENYPALQKYICDTSSPDLHPAAINEYSSIVSEHSRSLLQLVCKHQNKQEFNLDKIQEDIIVTYITGKLKIADCRTKLRKTFHYQSDSENKLVKQEHPTELMLKLHIADDIDDDFKVPVSKEDDFLVALEYEVLSMDFEKLVKVAQGLKTITEHVQKRLYHKQVHKEDIINDTIKEALPKLVYGPHEAHCCDSIKLFDDIGMTKIQDAQRTHIGAIPIKKLFKTLELVVEWIKDGIYDFYTLPKAMKKPLRKEDKQTIIELQQKYDQAYINELLDKLKIIVEVLADSQQHFVNNIDKIKERNIFEYLRSDLNIFCDEEDKIIKHFSKEILVENYMELRICLRKLMNKLEEDKSQGEGEESKWFEYVHDLWSEHKLQHLRDVSAPLNFDEVYNPITGLYGFQVADDMQLQDEEDKKEPSVEKHKEVPSQQQPLIQGQAMSVGGDDNLRKIASELTSEDIADYLRNLKFDEYIEKFKEFDVDGDMMFDIDYDTLETVLGVATDKDRVKIKTKFKQWLWKKII